MTTFALMSDLHLEFEKGFKHSVKIPEVDILLLAGDICTPWSPDEQQQRVFSSFFKEVSEKCKQTYVICGNHEHYMGYFIDTHEYYFDHLLKSYGNITLLNNQAEFHDGFAIFGSTFWTDLKNADPEVSWIAQRGMSDFEWISYSTDRFNTHKKSAKLLPDDIIKENDFSRKKLQKFLSDCEERDVRPIVLSHHALSYELTPSIFSHDLLSFAYANTGLEHLIYDVDCHPIFCYGHMHKRETNFIGKGKFMVNARGYLGHEPATLDYSPLEFKI